MRSTSVVRFLTLVMVASFALTGPLAPLAHAQQPGKPAQPAAPAQPAQPDQPAQQPGRPAPELFQETLKAQGTSDKSQRFYNAEAVVVNVFRVPGKAITCGLGAVVGMGLLALSLGSGYRAAAAITDEGCGGKWVVNGDDLRPTAPPPMGTAEPYR